MTGIDIEILSQVNGGQGASFNAETAFKALSDSYANGSNPNISGGVGEDNKFEMRLRADNGSGIVCTRTMGRRPTYACRTFTGE
jgi:hypothetical protein